MKTQTSKRLMSLLLVLCMLIGLVGVFPVFNLAADTSASGYFATVGTANSSGISKLLLYRSFEDGLSVDNGAADNDAAFTQVTSDDGNTYFRLTNSTGEHDYLRYDVGSYVPSSGSLVFQFDIMIEEQLSTSESSLLAINPSVRGSSSDVYVLAALNRPSTDINTCFGVSAMSDNGYTTSSGMCSTTYTATRGMTAGTWYTVTYVYTGSDMVNSAAVTCYWNGASVGTYTDTSDSSTGCTDVRPDQFRLGATVSGTSYCIDDVIIYTASTTDAATAAKYTINGSDGDSGLLYNPYGTPNVDADAYDDGYFFKVGALSALSADGTKATLTEAPFKYNEEVYIPVSALEAVASSPASAAVETVNGISCVNIENMSTAYSGYYASYSSMGLIGISTTQDLIKEGAELTLVPVMQKFLFDNISSSLTNANTFDASDLTSTDHPYLYANQTRFDELAEIWAAGQEGEEVDEVLYEYINSRVSYGQRLYDQYAQLDSDGNYSAMNTTVNLVRGYQDYIFEIPYQSMSSAGYDVGGRLGQAATNNEKILALAYTYQITKDINIAKLAYQYAIYMGEWEHWGPGHFLNAADAMSPYAIAYDWLYDAWTELESDGATYLYFNGTYTDSVPQFDTKTVSVAAIEEVLFTHGLIPAFYSLNSDDSYLPWQSFVSGWNFHTNSNNWNAVCSAGTGVAALALVGNTTSTSGAMIDVTVDGVYSATTSIATYPTNNTSLTSSYSTYQDYAEYIINQSLYNLPMYGLEQYVPDGSYIESPGYWSYGTNNLYELVAALTSTTGSDYGLLDAWGMDRTVYYALNTMSSDGISWNYHDSSTISPQDTNWFMYLANDEAMGALDLAGIRKNLTESFGSASYYDSIFYLSDEDIGEFEYPDVSYYMEGIDGYVVRDSWDADEGTLYAGILGNTNNLGHGQIDSAAFVYYNKGTRWFCDVGTEEYNAAGFWGATTRYRYYAMGGEGNNALIITDEPDTLPFGQSVAGFGTMYSTGSNEYGAYALINNTTSYAGFADSAKRGMLFTNDRKTVVIQDEATFSEAQNVAWIGHTLASNEIMISVDGKTAYMSDGTEVVKVTLIDNDNQGLKFSVIGCEDDDRLLDATYESDFSINNGGVAQKTYGSYKRLVILAEGVTSFNVAVVIEEVVPGETMNDTQGVGYSFTAMDSWTSGNLTADNRDDGSVDTEEETSEVAKITVVTPIIEVDDPGDTPFVDLFDTAWPTVTTIATTGGETYEYTAYSFDELAEIINANDGNTVTVELYKSNDTPISINVPCTVNRNGNELLATSESYVANVSGDTVKYETGSITVSWVLASGAIVSETYTGATVASYKGNITESTTIYEVDNGDNTYSYYTSGNVWALTENGKAGNSQDFIVSSENNVFYQTGREFDGLFVTVKGSTITGYYSATDFFTANILQSTKYDRISITNDFGYDSTGRSAIATGQSINLYLNGHTITYSSSENKHMFIVNGGDMNVYGPGSMRDEAVSGNIFYNDVTAGDNIYVENVDFYSVRAIIDLRCNTAHFKNCTVTIETSAAAMGALNRNNAATVNPKIIVDGCVIDMPAASTSSSVFSVQSNASIEVTGGTVITTGSACNLFSLTNNPVSSTDYDYENGYAEMEAIIGEVYHSLTSLYKCNSSSDGNTYDMSGKVYYGEGYTTTDDPSSLNILEGYVAAKNDSSLYIIVSEDDCAAVYWCDTDGIDITAAEYWVEGVTPTANDTVKSYVTVPSGQMLVFDVEEVEGGKTYYFNANLIDKFGLQVNMSLHSDFNLNFYVENIGDMTFKIDGVAVSADSTSNPGYYKVSKHGINPAMAGKSVKLEVTYNGSTISKSISPMDYAEKMLTHSSATEESSAMMANIIKYSEAAYLYTGNHIGEYTRDYAKVHSLYTEYKDLLTVAVVDRQGVDMSAVTDAISGAQLNLAESPRFRFNLKDNYTGTVTVNDTEYTVENGVCNDKTYIELTLKAYDLADSIVITTANGTATYSLANYYYYEVTEHGTLATLLNALCAYCETAKIYNDAQA